MSQIGFIGIGTIGAPMAERLLDANGALTVFDLNTDATDALVARGATLADGIGDIAQSCDTVFLSLPGPKEIQSVVAKDGGLLPSAGPLKTIVDLSTNSLSLCRQLALQAHERRIDYLDAPVSGGKIAARKGALAVMCGGNETAFRRVEPLIGAFGANITYLGASGAGTLAKLINNQIFLAASVLVQEGFVMGAKAGMDPRALLDVIQASSAAPYLERASLVLSKKFDLDIFSLAIAAKDVAVALDSAVDLETSMPMTEAAHHVYQQALDMGLGHEDFFATVKVFEQAAGCELPALKKPRDSG